MTPTLDHPAAGSRPPGASLEPPRRRAGGAVLTVVGLVVALALVLAVALSAVSALVRQEVTTRDAFTGVGAVRFDARCSGDVRVVADRALPAGAVEVDWRERWSVSRPRHDADVVDGELGLSTRCSRLSIGSEASSDVLVRLADGARLAVDTEVGDVGVSGVTGDVTVTHGVGDVDVRGADGAVSVRNGVGDVDVAGRLTSGEVSAGTGDVRLRSSTAPDTVSVKAGTGDVVVTLPGSSTYDVRAESGVGTADVGVEDDPGSPRHVLVSSGVGDVAVRTVG